MTTIRNTPPEALVFLQTGFVGDVILTTGAIALAKKHLPQCKLLLVTTKVGAQALEGHAELDGIIEFAKTKGLGLSAMRAVKASLKGHLQQHKQGSWLLQCHRSYRSALLGRYLGLPSVAYAEADAPWLATTTISRIAVLHEVQRLALLLEPFGIDRTALLAARPILQALPLDLAQDWQAALARASTPLIGIAPGSVWGTKRWLPEYFAELAARLLKAVPCQIVLIGSKAEAELCQSIAAAIPDAARVINIAGRTTLQDMRRVIPRLSLLLGNDSSPIHFASALNTPTLAFFGATVPGMGFAPLATASAALGVSLPCRPCSAHGPAVCPLQHFRCMRELTPELAFRQATALLGV